MKGNYNILYFLIGENFTLAYKPKVDSGIEQTGVTVFFQ